MNRFFKRGVEVKITRSTPGSFFSDQSSNQVTIRNLRVVFSVTKTLSNEPNTANIKVYNLNDSSRGDLQEKPLRVALSLGYDNDLSEVFQGDITWSYSIIQNTEWVTEIQAGEAQRAIRYARVNRSYRGGVTRKVLISDAARAMGLKLPTNADSIRELSDQLVSGATLKGSASRELTRVLAPKGVGWSVQGGRLQILKKGQALPEQAILISKDSGMIGSPEFSAPTQKGEPPKLKLQTMIRPEILPGGLVVVRSRNVEGQFKVISVLHSGDSIGSDFRTSLECRQL